MQFQFHYRTGTVADLTPAQHAKASDIAQRFNMTSSVEVARVFGLPGAIAMDTGTMFITILPDGSSHS